MPTQDEPLLDMRAAAQLLGVSERWMRRAIAERRIPFAKIGRYCRFRPADLRAYIEKHLVTPAR